MPPVHAMPSHAPTTQTRQSRRTCMADFSYVTPSRACTGSRMTLCDSGQMNAEGTYWCCCCQNALQASQNSASPLLLPLLLLLACMALLHGAPPCLAGAEAVHGLVVVARALDALRCLHELLGSSVPPWLQGPSDAVVKLAWRSGACDFDLSALSAWPC